MVSVIQERTPGEHVRCGKSHGVENKTKKMADQTDYDIDLDLAAVLSGETTLEEIFSCLGGRVKASEVERGRYY